MNSAGQGSNAEKIGVVPKRILIVDDHPVFRHGLADLICKQSDLTVCAHADSAPAALEQMRLQQPDLAILDVSLRGTNGIELIKLMRAEKPDLVVLMLSMHDESLYAIRALKAGALGYVMKIEALQYVVEGIRRVLEGKIYVSPRLSEQLIFKAVHTLETESDSPVNALSDRELEVLELLGKGNNTKSIANLLHLSIKTIETHRAHIKEKLGFKDASEMVKFAVDWTAQQQITS